MRGTHPFDKQGVLGDPLHGLKEEGAKGKSPRTGILGALLFKLFELRV